MRRLTETRLSIMADVCLFMIDARVGVTAVRSVLADMPALEICACHSCCHKAEGKAATPVADEAYVALAGRTIRMSVRTRRRELNDSYTHRSESLTVFRRHRAGLRPKTERGS